jgi:hypothetical protein
VSEFTCSTSLVLKQDPVHSFTGQEKKPGQLTSHDLSRFVSCSSEWLDLSLVTSIRKGNWTRSINPGVKGHPVQLGRKWIRKRIRTRSNTESHPVVRKYHKGPFHSVLDSEINLDSLQVVGPVPCDLVRVTPQCDILLIHFVNCKILSRFTSLFFCGCVYVLPMFEMVSHLITWCCEEISPGTSPLIH